jgi:riboflavin biosynthesis pyrimidine reductase
MAVRVSSAEVIATGAMLPPVRQLFPIPRDDVDPLGCYRAEDRTGSPWVLISMISTIDGATAIDGRSGGLGGPADKAVFGAVRSLADVILVGAGTARAENYGPPRVSARLAIVSASLDLATDAKVFADGYRPVVITTSDADPTRRAALEQVADVVVAGEHRVDVRAALASFSGVVVCEGGPSLNGQLIGEGLVDELCMSVAPLLASGDSSRIAHGSAPAPPTRMQLRHILEAEGYLFLRYLRAGDAP